jgi:hypothetical protein
MELDRSLPFSHPPIYVNYILKIQNLNPTKDSAGVQRTDPTPTPHAYKHRYVKLYFENIPIQRKAHLCSPKM